MQGLPGQNGSRNHNRPLEAQIASLRESGKQRAIPQRPPGMTRLDAPPEMPRAPRPKRPNTPVRPSRRLFVILGGFFVVAAVIACTVGYLLASGILSSAGPSTTATDFLGALTTQNYAQAYQDLGPAVTTRLSQDQFTRQAKALDSCYGPVTNYTQVANSATNNGNEQSYAYTLTRSKLKKTYGLRLTLQQDTDNNNAWQVASYDNNLGPTQGGIACQ